MTWEETTHVEGKWWTMASMDSLLRVVYTETYQLYADNLDDLIYYFGTNFWN